MKSFFHHGPPFDSEVEIFFSSWRTIPLEHRSTHHMEAWAIKLSHVLSFDRIDSAKIGLWRVPHQLGRRPNFRHQGHKVGNVDFWSKWVGNIHFWIHIGWVPVYLQNLKCAVKFWGKSSYLKTEHGSTHHMEAWTIKLSHVLSFDRIDFAKIGLLQLKYSL